MSDFLQQLAELDVQYRTAVAIERRLRHAGFPMVKEMSSYKFADVSKLNKKYVLDLARCQHIETKTNLVLTGPPGVDRGCGQACFRYDICHANSWPSQFSVLLRRLLYCLNSSSKPLELCSQFNVSSKLLNTPYLESLEARAKFEEPGPAHTRRHNSGCRKPFGRHVTSNNLRVDPP